MSKKDTTVVPLGNSAMEEEKSETWTASLFSPVLKLFADDDAHDASHPHHTDIELAVEDEAPELSIETAHNDSKAPHPAMMNEFDPFLFIAQLPPYDQVKGNIQCPTGLPPLANPAKMSLVLDLDETLVHCSAEPTKEYDVTFHVMFNGAPVQVFVRKRPHLDAFLHQVSQLYEVTVFTASQRVYAERLLDILDPEQRLIQHRLYRESCLMVAGNLLKDLSVLDRDLSKTLIIDNSPHAFGYHVDNGVPIESWFDDPHDTELLKLLPFLQRLTLHDVKDVRPHIRESFGLANLVRDARARV